MENRSAQPNLVRIKLLVLFGITLIAALFRLYRIDELPPAEGHDPAYYGLDALQILDGEWPVFFPSNFGREALFSYLVAVVTALSGISTHPMHIAAAVVGTLTVPATFLAAEGLFSKQRGFLMRYGGLIAALATALSYWHLNWSRYGVRAILLPLLAALTVYLFAEAQKKQSILLFSFTGAVLGLSLYTYQAARLLPFVIVLGFASIALSNRSRIKANLLNLMVVTMTAVMIFLPLGHYFVTHPGSFSERLGQTMVFSKSQSLADNLQTLAKQTKTWFNVLCRSGDADQPIHNLPDRPALNPFFSILFIIGVLISFRRFRTPSHAILLAWLLVMTVPAVLSQQGPVAKRAIGSLPAVMILIAVGFLAPADKLMHFANTRPCWKKTTQYLLLGLAGAGFLFSAYASYHDYFVRWANDPSLFTFFDQGVSSMGEFIRTLSTDERIYISPTKPQHPSILFRTQERYDLKWYNGRTCTIMPRLTEHRTSYLIVPSDDSKSLGLLQTYFPSGHIAFNGPLRNQEPYFLVYQIPKHTQVENLPDPFPGIWDGKIKITGFDLPSFNYHPGDTIQLALFFEPLDKIQTNYTVFVHLLGPHNSAANGPLWAQDDSQPCRQFYPTSVWELRELVRDQYTLTIPVDAPAGIYQLEVGFYHWPTMERLAVSAPLANQEASSLPLTEIYVQPPN